jgi:hypothetical protein
MGNQTAIAKGRVEVEAARAQARSGGDPSLGNPMEEMMVATHTALNATKNAGPLDCPQGQTPGTDMGSGVCPDPMSRTSFP